MKNLFETCKNLDELKKEYRKAAIENHPDAGGNEETMKVINIEYAARFEILKNAHNASADEHRKTTETPEEFINIVSKLFQMDGLKVELCGSWLWISGETIKNKEGLKAAGCRWSAGKKMWYWHHPEEGAKRSRGRTSLQDIRRKYGSSFLGDSINSQGKLEEATA